MSEREFYVHIIESPSPSDLFDGRTEGRMLSEFLCLSEIPYRYNLVVDSGHFEAALVGQVMQSVQELQRLPIIHISAHGCENGIQLTNQRESGQIIAWDQLRKSFNTLRGMFEDLPLGLCMSSCNGSAARKMAQVVKVSDIPVNWIVGTSQTVHYADAAIAFATFYRAMQRGDEDQSLIDAMRAASGVPDFGVEFGHDLQKNYSSRHLQCWIPKMDGTAPAIRDAATKMNPVLDELGRGSATVRVPAVWLGRVEGVDFREGKNRRLPPEKTRNRHGPRTGSDINTRNVNEGLLPV